MRWQILVGGALGAANALQPTVTTVTTRRRITVLRAGEQEEPAALKKAAWFATEAFGKVASLVRGGEEVAASSSGGPPRSLTEAKSRLAKDYEELYFISGKMDSALYDEDCEFADPFMSFRGRQRFEDNLKNLAGGFITESSARPLETSFFAGNATSPASYKTRLMVKLRLALPWQPVLAWPWGVEHVFNDEFLVVQHIESWDVSATQGLQQLLRPGRPNAFEKKQEPVVSKLGTKDPIAGPVVAFARSTGLLPKEEADGWSGEPTAWAESDSATQALSALTQKYLAGFKQTVAEVVAGEYDAAEIDRRLDDFIGSNEIAMFSFTSCPFCKKAKELLDEKGVKYASFELDEDADGAALRARLGVRSGRTSVPSVWIDGAFLGGLNDGNPGLLPLQEAGKLDALLLRKR